MDFEEEMIKIMEDIGEKGSQLKSKDKELRKHFNLGFLCGLMWYKTFGKRKGRENLHERN